MKSTHRKKNKDNPGNFKAKSAMKETKKCSPEIGRKSSYYYAM